jgi:flagellar biosynthesis chaperone FliJ
MGRLKTLVRVAELQEAVARGNAAKALAATRAAEQVQAAQLRLLRASRLEGGTREDLNRSVTRQLAMAAGVAESDVAVVQTEEERRSAVRAWTEARRRHRLFEELAERQREVKATAREREEQRLVDEIAASRATRR